MNRISSYIDENYLFPIRLKELAQMEQALRLAADKNLSLAELSDRSGFSNPQYLNKAFREKFGYSFREYKKSANQVTNLPQPENFRALQSYCPVEKSLDLIAGFQRFLKLPETDPAFIASVSTLTTG